ncbi:MAG: molybdopterin-dependent oxidoreductase [Desulfococcaceae bacterium]
MNIDRKDIVLRITGRVRKPYEIRMEELHSMQTQEIQDIPVICGSGTPKGSIGKFKGVLLGDLIRKADVLNEEHNDTKKMFIAASADDGYKVVFSWQEIFNTAVGGGVMIVIERDGTVFDGIQHPIELISAEDYFTGARYVKGLRNIELVLVQ